MKYYCVYLVGVVFSSLFICWEARAEVLPVKYFAGLPDVTDVALSPDGQHVASLNKVDLKRAQGSTLMVTNVKTGKSKSLVFTKDNEKYIRWVRWGNNTKILAGMAYYSQRYNTKTVETRLLIVDINSGKIRSAITDKTIKKLSDSPQFQDSILDMLRDDKDNFLLQMGNGRHHDQRVYKVSLERKRNTLVHLSEKDVIDWFTDQQHNLRVGLTRKNTSYKVIHTNPGKKKWKTLWEFESFSKDQVWPIGFSEDPNCLYVQARHEGRNAIFKVDLTDPNLSKELVYANEKYDVSGSLVYSKVANKVVGINVSDGVGYVFWDEERRKFMDRINKGLPNTENHLISMSDDERKYIIFADNDTDPGAYYLGDRDKGTLSVFAERYQNLDPRDMAEKELVRYQARDGVEIEGYLTLPVSHQEGEKHPTIIFPHGGPISLTGPGFDYWTQFFANQGYAVLQMNFRGSWGYGYNFMAAGIQKWGLKMQDDIEDGTKWMIDQGFSKLDSICIVGASYGGYAALMGAIKSKGLYQCAVSFAGVTDLDFLVNAARKYTNHKVVKAQVGDKKRDREKRSPIERVEDIDIPVLLIHGDRDRTVGVSHSRKMYKSLKKHKKSVRYVELEEGSHYLKNNKNRIATFQAMADFLEANL